MRYFLSSISMHTFTVTCMLQCCWWCCVSAACFANLHFFEDEFVPYAVLSDQSSLKLRLLPTEGKIQEPFFQRSVGLTEDLVRVRVDQGGWGVGGDKNKQTLHSVKTLTDYWVIFYIYIYFSQVNQPCQTCGWADEEPPGRLWAAEFSSHPSKVWCLPGKSRFGLHGWGWRPDESTKLLIHTGFVSNPFARALVVIPVILLSWKVNGFMDNYGSQINF